MTNLDDSGRQFLYGLAWFLLGGALSLVILYAGIRLPQLSYRPVAATFLVSWIVVLPAILWWRRLRVFAVGVLLSGVFLCAFMIYFISHLHSH